MKDKNKERITIEISAELKKKVVVYCAENGIKSVKEIITNLIDEALDRQPSICRNCEHLIRNVDICGVSGLDWKGMKECRNFRNKH